MEPEPGRFLFQGIIFSLQTSFRSYLLISMLSTPTSTPQRYPLFPTPKSFSPMLFYSTTWEETSIIFAWKLFINLPVKHSIEPFTSYYRNLLGTYWQLSKYLHKALKHLVPSERRSCCVKQRIIKHLSLYLFPSFIKGSFLLTHL